MTLADEDGKKARTEHRTSRKAPLPLRSTDVPCVCLRAEQYTLKGGVSGRALYIDFSKKGGPSEVRAEWTGVGLAFPDGNVWTKL